MYSNPIPPSIDTNEQRKTRLPRFLSLSGLRGRLILLVLLAIIPALGIILYTALETRQREATRVKEEALTRIQLLSADQERTIEGARQLLIALSQLQDVRSGDPAACTARLIELLKLYPDYNGFGVAKPDGEIFCSTATSAQPVNAANRPWFQRAVQTHNFAVGDYQVGRISGQTILVFSYPIFDAEGQLQAVAFAVLELGKLNQLATTISLPDEGGILTQIDRNGTILDRSPNPERWVGQTLPEVPIIQMMLSRREGVAEVTGIDGVTRLYAFTPLNSVVETGLYLSIGLPLEVAFAEVNWTLARNLTWLGLVGLLALLAAWFGSDTFVLRRIKVLVNATERLRRGDLSTRTGLPDGGGELGQLARAFDDMAATLEQREAERKQAEEVIREQREWLQVTLSSIGDAVIATDTAGRITFMNPVAQSLTGWSQTDALDKPLEEVFHIVNETTRHRVENPVTKVIREGTVVGLANHTILIAADGREVPIDDSGAPIRDEQGWITGVVLVFRDITERKQAEERLHLLVVELEQRVKERTAELQTTNLDLENQIAEREQAEERLAEERTLLRTLIDNLPDYVYIKDTQSRFITTNQAVARDMGFTSPEELVGKTDFDIFPPELAAQYYADEQAVIQSGQPLINREEVTVYAGEQGWASTTTIPLCDQQGEVIGLVGISRDITERKRLGAELAEIQHRLIESREAERLHLAQELHDGPVQDLHGLTYNLSGLKVSLTDPNELAQLEEMRAVLQQVIRTLRNAAAELRPPTLAPFGLEKALRSHVEQFQTTHPELKLELELMADGQGLPERVRLALFRICQETLNNIIRHAHAQQVWLRFMLEADQVVLEVQDDGQGFEVPRRWLELARRGHLGLVGIAERAEAIGGQLQIISTPGAGTRIRVVVPNPSSPESVVPLDDPTDHQHRDQPEVL